MESNARNLFILLVTCFFFSFAGSADVDLANLPVSKGISIHGGTSLDESGWSVSGAGDVNADGIGDVIIGAPKAQVGVQVEAGIAYVLFGKSGPFSGFQLPASAVPLSANVGFRILGAVAGDHNGHAVSGAGDVNNDGIDDIIVGALMADVPGKSAVGITYIIFGRDLSINGHIPFGDVQVTAGSTPIGTYIGFRVIGNAAGDRCGSSVSRAGDVNGDGIDDVIIGAFNANGGAGVSYVIFGRDVASTGVIFADIPLPGNVMYTDVGFRILGAAASDGSGGSVSAAGDINNDGVDDIIVGAKGADPLSATDAGIAYVIFGRKLALPGATPFGDIQLTSGVGLFDPDIGFSILGAAAYDHSGMSVSAAGDVNGDNIDDLIVGANGVDLTSKTDAGVAYVIFGRDYTDTMNVVQFNELQLTSGANPLSTDEGFRILGAATGDFLGYSVRAAGDTNGDGIGDIIIGAYAADRAGVPTCGKTYVVYGRNVAGGAPAFGDIDLSNTLSDVIGYRIVGAAEDDYSGYSVSGAGDINNDGMGDIIIGAHQAGFNGETYVGASYILFGFNLYPTSQPSGQPSRQPSAQPSRQPTAQPSMQPSGQPTKQPSCQPTAQPTIQPTVYPTSQPSIQPSSQPSVQPISLPSAQPSTTPSSQPSSQPTVQPTSQPSSQPSLQPSKQPSSQPSCQPSAQPSTQPSSQPSIQPTKLPSAQPTDLPSSHPTTQPSTQPSMQPSRQPSSNPSNQPSNTPSRQPSIQPSAQPTEQPTVIPSMQPSGQPSGQPTSQPSTQPASAPSAQPLSEPSGQPSEQPSTTPSAQPTSVPSMQPSVQPSMQPSNQPSSQPSKQPSSQPTSLPTISKSVTGEWSYTFNDISHLNTTMYHTDALWVCGSYNQSGFTAQCATFDARSGTRKSKYLFQLTDVTFLLPTTAPSNVILGGVTLRFPDTKTDIAYCANYATQLQCSVQSYANTILTAGTYVPFATKNVYVGTYNTQATVALHNTRNNVTNVYRYSTNKMASVTLSHVLSPPVFIGAFLAGPCLSTALVNHICTGMVRTDSAILTAMYLTPAAGNIVNNVELVNAMALEYENPDSFIAGGLELSDGTGMHAYVTRVNSLYYSVLYGMRYTIAMQPTRRTLTEANIYQSVVKGMVRIGTSLIMVINVHSTSLSTTSHIVALLRVDMATGQILQQVQVESQQAEIQCTDLTSTELYLAVACTTTAANHVNHAVVITMDTNLILSALPEGFRRYENNTLVAEPILFRRTALSLSPTNVLDAYTEYTFNTEDGYQTASPTTRPTSQPSAQPSSAPSGQPSSSPTAAPSVSPQPTNHPSSSGPTNTYKPTVKPTQRPSPVPSKAPTVLPTVKPTFAPTARPSVAPSVTPSVQPTIVPTIIPTRCPSVRPTRTPTMIQSTYIPTFVPTASPTKRGRRVYEAYASMILGYVVGGLILLWCAYHLCLFGMYKAELVKVDEKLMSEIRSIGLEPKPRHPVSRAVLHRFIKVPPSDNRSQHIVRNNTQQSTPVAAGAHPGSNMESSITTHQNTTTNHTALPTILNETSYTASSGADILRHIIQDNQQISLSTTTTVQKGAFINSPQFVDLEANLSYPVIMQALEEREADPIIARPLAATQNVSQNHIADSNDSAESDKISVDSSEMSDWIDQMLDQESISDSSWNTDDES